MKKKVLTILLTVLLFLSAVALGISTVFRVNGVSVEATLLTAEEKSRLPQLQAELTALYDKDSIFSVNDEKAQALIEKYPYLRVTGFSKSYPNRLTVTIVEESEVYEVYSADKKYVLGREGIIVRIADASESSKGVRVDGLIVTGEKGGSLSGDQHLSSVLTLCMEMDKVLNGIGRNILSVEVLQNAYENIYRLKTREGVNIYVHTPATLTKEKVRMAVDKYLSLADGERMVGRILVLDVEGSVSADYDAEDKFAGLN